jgi:transcriptional regulator with XRE-family HTH domain
MVTSAFIKQRRAKLDLSQAKLAQRLTDLGQTTSHTRVAHWESGRNKPPLEDPKFRVALAVALEIDVNDMMAELGYVVTDEHRSAEALIAAEIVDQLPAEAKQLAIDYLRVLEKRFVYAE